MMKPKLKRAIAKVNGVNLFYRDTLSGDQTIFCLHGRWGRGETWTDLIAHYRDRYRIVAPDQRGHGLSDKPICRKFNARSGSFARKKVGRCQKRKQTKCAR